ncbi:unnamed protein product [Symbiodinium natans]|uniref:Uncharacterized protein n=1 Tax=Symbiodinium natans TaxID=878477 RepID=A0A812U672_9DINO|nr:unnamed protein product [Symbiodinium natans]
MAYRGATLVALVILLRIRVWGYKVYANSTNEAIHATLSFCQVQTTAGSDTSCAKILEQYKCFATWESICPGVDHPLGVKYNRWTVAQFCQKGCEGKEGEPSGLRKVPLSEIGDNFHFPESGKEKITCLTKLVSQAEAAGDEKKEEIWRKLLKAEMALELEKIAEMDHYDKEDAAQVKVVGLEVAEEQVKEDFDQETNQVLEKVQLSDAEIQKYIAALEEASGPQSQSSH